MPAGRESYALHEPSFEAADWEAVRDCVQSGWVSSAGPHGQRFEALLAARTGTGHAVALASGTAALHLALELAGVAPGDEVITPALSFVATANAVSYCGALPHFVDSERETLGLDPARLELHLAHVAERRDGAVVNRESGRPISAILATHVLGHPADLEGLASVARAWRLPLIEDAAEALGSHRAGRHVATTGLMAALSFNGNKLITTGGGGALLTDDADLAARARHLSTTAKRPHPWRYDHDEIGYNYRLPDLNAALGCAQLERLTALLAAKRRLAARYAEALGPIEGLTLVREPTDCESNHWLNAILLDDAGKRDPLLEALHAAGIRARPLWTLLPTLPIYAAAPRTDLSVAEDLERRVICLPSSPDLA